MTHRLNPRTILAALVALVVLVAAQPAAAQKIGVIDSQRIFATYQQAKDAEALFQEEMRGWEQELAQQEQAIMAEREKLRSQALLLSDEKKQEIQAKIQRLLQDYEARKGELMGPEGLAVQRQQELSQPLNDQITTVVERLAAERDYDLVLDIATVNVVFMNDGIDITDDVLAELERGGS